MGERGYHDWCPNCGSTGPFTIMRAVPGLLSFWRDESYYVECRACGYATGSAPSPREAEDNWRWMQARCWPTLAKTSQLPPAGVPSENDE